MPSGPHRRGRQGAMLAKTPSRADQRVHQRCSEMRQKDDGEQGIGEPSTAVPQRRGEHRGPSRSSVTTGCVKQERPAGPPIRNWPGRACGWPLTGSAGSPIPRVSPLRHAWDNPATPRALQDRPGSAISGPSAATERRPPKSLSHGLHGSASAGRRRAGLQLRRVAGCLSRANGWGRLSGRAAVRPREPGFRVLLFRREKVG